MRDEPKRMDIAGRLKFLAGDTLLYGGASAIAKSFAFISFPIIARHFSVGEYGLLDLFTSIAGLLAVLAIFGQDSSVARYYYEYEDDEARHQLITQSLLFQLAASMVIVALLWPLAGRIAGAVSGSGDAATLLKLVLAQVPFIIVVSFAGNILKWTFTRSGFLVMTVGYSILQLGAIVIGILAYDIDLPDYFKVTFGINVVFSAVGLVLMRRWLAWPAGTKYLRIMAPFAIPYGIIGFASMFVPLAERSLVNSLLGGEQLGLYAAGSKVALLIMMIATAFQTAWGPFFLSIHKQRDAPATYALVLKIFTIIICLGTLAIAALSEPVIVLLASSRYANAAVVVFPLAMAFAIQATGWIMEIGIGLSKKSYLSLVGYLVFLAASCILIYMLTLRFGIIGTAVAVMLGQFIRTAIASMLAQRVYPLPWPYTFVIVMFAATLCIGIAGSLAYRQLSASGSIAVWACGLSALLAIAWFAGFTGRERRKIGAAIAAALHTGRA